MNPRLYRIIVIDPAARTIEEVQTTGSHEEICALVGALALDHFRIADHDLSWDYGWCDDMGLARGRPIHAFLFAKRTDPIAGRCVLIGASKEGGGNCDALFPMNVLHQEITWLGLIRPMVTTVETEMGSRTVVSFERITEGGP